MFIAGGQPGGERVAPSVLFLTAVMTFTAWWWDKSRKAVVAMYDLSDEVAGDFNRFSV
jgi:hypothetical protein